jgi:hypothetical protein
MIDGDFEKYFQKMLVEDQELIKELPYNMEQLRDIYRLEYEYQKEIEESKIERLINYQVRKRNKEIDETIKKLDELNRKYDNQRKQIGVRIDGYVYPNQGDLEYFEFWDAFIDFIESKGWQFGGGSFQVDDEGNKVNDIDELRYDIDNNKLTGKNTNITVTDELPPGVTKEEYRILEDHYAPELNELELSEAQWIELPPNKTITEYYNEKRKKRAEKRIESKLKTDKFRRNLKRD